MNICILGASGVIGNGIKKKFHKHKIINFNSNFYDFKKKKYKLQKINKKVDLFIHAGGVTDEEVKKDSFLAFHRASENTTLLLDKLLKKNCKNYIYISSMRIYSEQSNYLHEKITKINLDNLYKLSHFVTEKIFIDFCKKNKKKYLIVRPGAVYGFAEKKINRQKLIPYSFPNELIKKNSITLKSSGNQFRNFSSNEDVGNIILKWIRKKNRKSTITNLKGNNTLRVREFAKLCIKIFYKISNIKSQLYIKSKNPAGSAENLKVNQVFKFKAKGNLEKFIVDYIKLLYNKR